jgi:hypothetical protein
MKWEKTAGNVTDLVQQTKHGFCLHEGSPTGGPHMALAIFLCVRSHDLRILQCKKDIHFLLLRNTDINIYLRVTANNKKKLFNETNKKFVYNVVYNVKIADWRKGKLFRCSNHMTFS